MEIACDESGYEGEKLIGTTTPLFAHGSVRLETGAAAECMAELRARIRSPATEYKAGHVLREKHRAVLEWLLGPAGPVAGRAHVFLLDKERFFLSRLAPEPESAEVLHAEGPREFGPEKWAAFLLAANDLMRSRDPQDPLEALRAMAGDGPAGRILGDLKPNPRVEDPFPPLDPLFPAIVSAVEVWSGSGSPVEIIHDRQKTLTPQRIEQLKLSCRGRLGGVILADSSVDPRVQMADVVAGAVRRIAEDELRGHGNPKLIALSQPLRGKFVV